MRISTAGIARRGDTFLVALRNPGTSIGESWEFPGGKAERGEDPPQALIREFREELGAEAAVGELIYEGRFFNRDREYRLLAFEVTLSNTEFELREHQAVRWMMAAELAGVPMASSDRQIVDYLLGG